MSSKIKVLLLSPVVTTGGIATWTKILLRLSANVDWHLLDTSKTYEKLTKPVGVRGVVLGLIEAARRIVRVFHRVVKVKPDVVYMTCAPSIGLLRDAMYCILLRFFGLKVIMHLREGDTVGFFEGGRSAFRKLFARITGGAFSRCSCLIVITRKVEAAAKERFPGTRVVYLPNMIELQDRAGLSAEVAPPDQTYDIRILHVGWQDDRKGVFELLDALKHTRRRVLCNLVGDTDPEFRVRIDEQIRQIPNGSKVIYNGPLFGDALWKMYYGADAFVFPSRSEGFPNVLLEAMSAGLPAIVTDIGNMREMIAADSDTPCGLICGLRDPEDIAGKIDTLAGDAELRARLGENARQRVHAKYDANIVVPEIENLVASVVSQESRA